MYGITGVKRLSEPPKMSGYSDGRAGVIYLDNFSSHVEYDNVQECSIKTKKRICKLPANETHLVQPSDSFLIPKIEDAWRHLWEEYSLKAVKEGLFNDNDNPGANENLASPGKILT